MSCEGGGRNSFLRRGGCSRCPLNPRLQTTGRSPSIRGCPQTPSREPPRPRRGPGSWPGARCPWLATVSPGIPVPCREPEQPEAGALRAWTGRA